MQLVYLTPIKPPCGRQSLRYYRAIAPQKGGECWRVEDEKLMRMNEASEVNYASLASLIKKQLMRKKNKIAH